MEPKLRFGLLAIGLAAVLGSAACSGSEVIHTTRVAPAQDKSAMVGTRNRRGHGLRRWNDRQRGFRRQRRDRGDRDRNGHGRNGRLDGQRSRRRRRHVGSSRGQRGRGRRWRYDGQRRHDRNGRRRWIEPRRNDRNCGNDGNRRDGRHRSHPGPHLEQRALVRSRGPRRRDHVSQDARGDGQHQVRHHVRAHGKRQRGTERQLVRRVGVHGRRPRQVRRRLLPGHDGQRPSTTARRPPAGRRCRTSSKRKAAASSGPTPRPTPIKAAAGPGT